MRIFQIETFYPPFLKQIYGQSDMADLTYDEQIERLMFSGFSAGHMVTPYLPDLGHEAFTCIANCGPAQHRWLIENVPEKARREVSDLQQVMLMQIEAFRPDVVYATDPTYFDTKMIEALSYRPRLCIAWRAAPTPSSVDLSGFDLTLTSDPSFKAICESVGAKRVEYHYPGHPLWVNETLGPPEPTFDIVFSGQVGGLHRRRVQILESVLPALAAHGLRVGLFALGSFPDNPTLNALNRGPVFGLDMYDVLRRSLMTLNVVIDVASKGGINMRHFEATGVGSLVVDCGARDNIIFEQGRECFCFERVGETIDGILGLMENPGPLAMAAAMGQRKCLTDYEMEVRTKRFIEICEKEM